jgi:hypothetical protein
LTSFAVLKELRNKNLRSLSSLFAVIILGRPLVLLGGGGEVNAGRSLLAAITLRTAAAFLFSLMAISLGATPSVNNFKIVAFSPTSNCFPLGMMAENLGELIKCVTFDPLQQTNVYTESHDSFSKL